jgi:hypothetical protein
MLSRRLFLKYSIAAAFAPAAAAVLGSTASAEAKMADTKPLAIDHVGTEPKVPTDVKTRSVYHETAAPLGPSAIFLGDPHVLDGVCSYSVKVSADQPFRVAIVDSLGEATVVRSTSSREAAADTHQASLTWVPAGRYAATQVTNGASSMQSLSVVSELTSIRPK